MVVLVTLVGDLVGSRTTPDRAPVLSHVVDVLDELTALLRPAQPLETVPDELRGVFGSVEQAVLASLLVRLRLREVVDVRIGLGHGEVDPPDGETGAAPPDGPGWWAARAALTALGEPRAAGSSTWYDAGPLGRVLPAGPDAVAVNGFLVVRDALVDRLGHSGRRMLALSLQGLAQHQIAERLGVSRSAVSQQFTRGVGALSEAHRRFGELAVPAATGVPAP